MPSHVRKIKVHSRKKYKSGRKKKITLRSILKSKQKKIRLVFLTTGLILVFGAFYISRPQKQPSVPVATSNNTAQTALSSSFANEPVSVDEKLLVTPKKKPAAADLPVRIIIPSLNIDLPVKEAKVVDGYWQVFSDSAGFGQGSALPGERGNSVIFAHARQGLFAPLKDIETGSTVIVMTENKWYSYSVTQTQEVLPSQTEVIAPTDTPVLTLYTCSGYADSKRLIVSAKLNPAVTP